LTHKFLENLICRFLARLNIWVEWGIVKLCNIIQFHLTVLINIKLLISQSDQSLSEVIYFSLIIILRYWNYSYS
jgi:hypothetical protein